MKDRNQELTPMLAQYHYFKNEYSDCLLFFRLGDFYELFYEDAVVGSKELNLVLTSRPAGKGRERIPMCGVPYHSADNYIKRLVQRGFKIAICEQVEDASQAKSIVKREVVRVITPGTYFEKDTAGFACIYRKGKFYYLAYLNLSIGDFVGARVKTEELLDFLSKFNIKELLIKEGEEPPSAVIKTLSVFITKLDDEFFEEGVELLRKAFDIHSARALGFDEEEFLIPLGAAYRYAKLTQKGFTPFIKKPKPFQDEGFVRIDLKVRRGLELLESIEGRKDHSLFGVLDMTLTGMGRRRLKFHILNPFRNVDRISKVQEAVEELVQNREKRCRLREILSGMADLERLVSRISANMATPRDILHLKNTLYKVEDLREEIGSLGSGLFKDMVVNLESLKSIADEIDRVLVDEPPIHVKEGGLIKAGVDGFLDELRFVRDNTRKLLKEYEKKLRKETGISSLKVGYNKVMGYYIEVTKPNLKYVPEHFRRRQTLTNAERFITEELSRLEEKILSAQSRINDIEYELFVQLREKINGELEKVGRNAQIVGEIDYIQALAEVADKKGWVKPEVNDEFCIEIEEGKHPVIEAFTRSYVPNDTFINEESFIHLITGPNMAGKSSYIRQVALIVLLAHMGSFVPAKRAKIGSVDAIYTRIGSGDILALGVSTFMNEMLDVASMLLNATDRSLIILDEIGRGTSTYDGIAITKALTEFISRRIGARTLLATHFLELTELEGKVRGVKNYHMAVSEEGSGVVFLYTLLPGKAEGSFGIEVARMAGLPEELINRAKEILLSFEDKSLPLLEETFKRSEKSITEAELDAIIEDVLSIDVANTTPLQALLKLAELKEKIIRVREGR
ncbi:DNA mismatch repair protein MutS [Hydrogenivirga caldilitoris]|uniref:DNA mismatch repair protein MutS n=1 Tax=Hydrogenivirga caldilitoris TaxID=246264 RepID=A0A497XQ79_9AQUI|nr:DNA mismatch repair protein MutS [Hydrogenivirga caldilitoris]RLJ70310.1 DNA mismatch repair protein MutS [Hydrogenivirga caldilitoris]